MRFLNRFSLAILFAALCCAYPVIAQFREPTREELEMKADPMAPDAAAVYLYVEDTTDVAKASRTYYERLKVLTEKGKEAATLRIPYEPGQEKVEVQGRTIHADGSIVPLTAKPSDLVDLKTKDFQRNTLVFTMPSVEVGCILDYRITVKYTSEIDDPTWMIQQTYFVHKAHYVFNRPNYFEGASFIYRLGNNARVESNKKGAFWLDIEDVPALPDEDWMPPLNTVKWRVVFFYSRFPNRQEFWTRAAAVWQEFVSGFTKPTATLKKAAADLVAPGDTETQKAQKIYAAVMKLENTDFTRHKSEVERRKEKIKEIKNATDVWREQQGTSDEIALLFVALCRAADLRVVPMEVVDRSERVFDEGLLTSKQLDDYIAVGQFDGKEVFLDPGQKMTPFGMLHWKHAMASGFRLTDRFEVTITRTPEVDYKLSSTQRIADLAVEESGQVKGTVSIVLNGQDALRWRQLALENDPDEVKKQFNEWMRNDLPEGVQAEFDHFGGIDTYNSNLLAFVKVSGSLGTTTGKRFFLPGQFFQSKARHPFVARDKRTVAVDVHYPRSEQDDVTYRLPDGYSMESGPKTDRINWPAHAGFANVTKGYGNWVNVVRNLAYNYTLLNPQEYDSLHDFYQKVAEADQEQLVLARPTAAKLN